MTPTADPSSRPPHILLIVDDQHSPRAMGWTGECEVATPNLDRLAAESVCFLNGYTPNPVCGPARHCVYTGRYASEHGSLRNDVPMRALPTMMARLNDAGYTTASVGKLHNTPFHARRDFQYVLHHEFFRDAGGISHYASYLAHELQARGLPTPHDWLIPRPGKRNWLEHPETIGFVDDLPEELTAERWTTDQSLQFIREQLAQRAGRPFFLHTSYHPPHHPYAPVERYARPYLEQRLELPPSYDRRRLREWGAHPHRPAALTDDDVRRLRALYFGYTTQIDAEIGRLLRGLAELGVADDTVVIFVSDHGDMIGEHGVFYKGYMYEGSARIPFMIRWPGVQRARREAALVSLMDLPPTILAAAGARSLPESPGADLRPLIAGEPGWPDRAVYSEFLFDLPFTHLMLRRGDHKLIVSSAAGAPNDDPNLSVGRNGHAGVELFDVAHDPWELRNLAGAPEAATIQSALRDELGAVWERQRRFMPAEQPPDRPRSEYDLPWPANPWQPVQPAPAR